MLDAVQHIARFHDIGGVQGNVHLGSHRRQRTAQLMRGVADEPALALRRVLQSGQHLVHRDGKARYLVAAARDGNPFLQVGSADGGGALPDLFDRGAARARRRPRSSRPRPRGEAETDGQQGAQPVEGNVHLTQGRRDVDPARSVPEYDRLGDDPEGLSGATDGKPRGRHADTLPACGRSCQHWALADYVGARRLHCSRPVDDLDDRAVLPGACHNRLQSSRARQSGHVTSPGVAGSVKVVDQ